MQNDLKYANDENMTNMQNDLKWQHVKYAKWPKIKENMTNKQNHFINNGIDLFYANVFN